MAPCNSEAVRVRIAGARVWLCRAVCHAAFLNSNSSQADFSPALLHVKARGVFEAREKKFRVFA